MTRSRRAGLVADGAVVTAYLLTSLWVLSGLVGHLGTRYLAHGVQDQQAFEWYLGASAHNVLTTSNPLFSDRQNFPDGVNLMANAAVIGLGIPLTPVTDLLGAQRSFFLVTWLGLAGTAAAWYWLFRRRLGVGRVPAALGGWLTGFAPGMVAHANGHLNFVAAALVPLLVDRVVRLHEDGRPWRDGLVLGLLAAWQVLIGEEVLLLAALGGGVVLLVLLASGRVRLRALLPGLAVGAGVSIALVAVPLWWQFAGPQSYTSLWHPPGGNDLAALWGRATRTVGADPWASAALSMNRTEENAFFGVPLLVAAALVVVALWRRPLVRALAVLVVLACWASLGEEVLLRGEKVPVPSLWALLDGVPVLGNVLPTRFALVAVPPLAALLALGVHAAGQVPLARQGALSRRWVQVASGWAAAAAAVLALLPLVPTPLVTAERPLVPAFFATGAWRGFVDDGSVLAVPPTDIVDARAFDWQRVARMGFPIVEGYFVGPTGQADGGGRYGAPRRPFSLWLYAVAAEGTPRTATAQERALFVADLRAWRTDVLVLPRRPDAAVLLASVRSVLGEPRVVEDVWLWDVRALQRR
ncbi:MAG TPA: glycosyl transferase [Dermatophilaceae bacterium]|nr:glycosyl transferase [Dermatophilaceae bacterium]